MCVFFFFSFFLTTENESYKFLTKCTIVNIHGHKEHLEQKAKGTAYSAAGLASRSCRSSCLDAN